MWNLEPCGSCHDSHVHLLHTVFNYCHPPAERSLLCSWPPLPGCSWLGPADPWRRHTAGALLHEPSQTTFQPDPPAQVSTGERSTGTAYQKPVLILLTGVRNLLIKVSVIITQISYSHISYRTTITSSLIYTAKTFSNVPS